jgi:hypothetical protein
MDTATDLHSEKEKSNQKKKLKKTKTRCIIINQLELVKHQPFIKKGRYLVIIFFVIKIPICFPSSAPFTIDGM